MHAQPAGRDSEVGDAARTRTHPGRLELGAAYGHGFQAGEDNVEKHGAVHKQVVLVVVVVLAHPGSPDGPPLIACQASLPDRVGACESPSLAAAGSGYR